MVNELRDLLLDATDRPPQDDPDLSSLLRGGRRRVRVRRARVLGASALATAATVAATSFVLDPDPVDLDAAGVPRPEGPVLRLSDARTAVEGTDYRRLTSYVNEDLESDNGQYFDGVTDDGLVLFRDGPRAGQRRARYALMDPATGAKDWLPPPDLGHAQTFALALTEERLVLLSLDDSRANADFSAAPLVAHVFDRDTRSWKDMEWAGLPGVEGPFGEVSPDGRLYVRVPATRGGVPEGGWPTGSDGEADDADADGDTYDLWSVSLDDPDDVRDEGLRVGSVAFTDESMAWTDSTGGDAGKVHVRDLDTGEETSFDPGLGERCNLLGFDAAGDRITLSQYCGTYEGGVRDDRVQVMTTEGDRVVTIQDSGIEGGLLVGGGDYLTLTAYEPSSGGTYLYNVEDNTLRRLSDGHAVWAVGQGPVPGDHFLWNEPAGSKIPVLGHSGAAVHLGEVVR